MIRRFFFLSQILLAGVLLASCAGNPDSGAARRCSGGLDAAYGELERAKVDGFNGTVEWSKAASLLTAAKVQYEFGKYPNCIEKVNRARNFIRNARGG